MTREQARQLGPLGVHAKFLSSVDDYLLINGPYLTAREAARRLGVSMRTICRYRAHLGLAAPLAPCGTWAAYRRHLRRCEPVDDACRKAASAYVMARRAARKAAA